VEIQIHTPGIHHIALRSNDLARSKRFYTETLGFPVLLENGSLLIFRAGSIAVGVRRPDTATPRGDGFNPFRVGLDHLALAYTSETERERVAAALFEAGVENTGAKTDPTLNKKYIAFKDPDRISWELYMV
jgi:catechol 2,3-dioxygenase-like lactoylglutathione lyase family enzyme